MLVIREFEHFVRAVFVLCLCCVCAVFVLCSIESVNKYVVFCWTVIVISVNLFYVCEAILYSFELPSSTDVSHPSLVNITRGFTIDTKKMKY